MTHRPIPLGRWLSHISTDQVTGAAADVRRFTMPGAASPLSCSAGTARVADVLQISSWLLTIMP